jgi:hypothetical protein
MFIGYCINDSHPCLKTISFSDIDNNLDKPILIIGFEYAAEMFPDISLETKTIDVNKRIYYSFSKEESESKYLEHLNNFIKHCFEIVTSKYQIANIVDLTNVEIKAKEIFLHETSISISITTSEKIYYFNKEIIRFFNNLELTSSIISKLISTETKIISWNCHHFFSAYTKANGCYKSKEEIRLLYNNYGDIDLYMGALCMYSLKDCDLNIPEVKIWERAYSIETSLSQIKVKVDVQEVKKLASDDENLIMQDIYKSLENGYINQNYNGTDKITGRIFTANSGYTLQTLAKPARNIIIAEPNCILVEFDYNYFEYNLLGQLCDFNIKGDPHLHMSRLLFNDELHRTIGKGINYSLIYGKSLDTTIKDLQEKYSITIEKAKLLNLIKPITVLQKKLNNDFKINGYITNYFGRKIYSEKSWACLNNYIQATAAEIIIIKLEKLFSLLKGYNSLNKILLQNHDSILLNLRIEDIEKTEIANDIKNLLEKPENKLTSTVDIKYGYNWRDIS